MAGKGVPSDTPPPESLGIRVLGATRPKRGEDHLPPSVVVLPQISPLSLQAQRLNNKPGREEKRAGLARRRGRQRGGTRPVCRGCYSGLMIVAPPGPEGNHSSTQESHSESAWESSEED